MHNQQQRDHDCDSNCDHGHDEYAHEHSPADELITVRDLVRYATSRFNRKKIFFGHGLQDAYDEAVYLVLHTLHLPLPTVSTRYWMRVSQPTSAVKSSTSFIAAATSVFPQHI